MLKKYALLFLLALTALIKTEMAYAEKNAKQFSFDHLTSEDVIDLSNYKDDVLLIVNTASKCGFTGQYEGLEKLYQKYQDKGLVVIGVPSNDFGSQEPGSNEEIADFCKFNYGVTFPMTSKYSVKGDNAHPFYQWAKSQLGFGSSPKWNFHKYLVSRDGELVRFFLPTTKPNSRSLIEAIEKELKS
ncbi:MAG: glutathione peroxidase [Pseudomonadota bacterium]